MNEVISPYLFNPQQIVMYVTSRLSGVKGVICKQFDEIQRMGISITLDEGDETLQLSSAVRLPVSKQSIEEMFNRIEKLQSKCFEGRNVKNG